MIGLHDASKHFNRLMDRMVEKLRNDTYDANYDIKKLQNRPTIAVYR